MIYIYIHVSCLDFQYYRSGIIWNSSNIKFISPCSYYLPGSNVGHYQLISIDAYVVNGPLLSRWGSTKYPKIVIVGFGPCPLHNPAINHVIALKPQNSLVSLNRESGAKPPTAGHTSRSGSLDTKRTHHVDPFNSPPAPSPNPQPADSQLLQIHVKMSHESVWYSRPRTYGKGSRQW